jgi:hypothetical protein
MHSKNKWWQYAVVIATSAVVAAFFQAQPSFQDPDSFYHTRLVVMMLQGGLLEQFPWLQYTDLATTFTDHHLLYHLLLVPFVGLLTPVVGVKVFQALSLVGLATYLFHRLQRWQLPHGLPAMVVLFGVMPFLLRIQLVKASVLAILMLLFILFNLLERRYILVAAATVLYTWLHAGFILALVVAGVAWCAETIGLSVEHKRLRLASWRALALVVVATGFGVVANPYFPENLRFIWQQLIQIGFVNYSDTIQVGAEWYPFSLPDLVAIFSTVLIGVTMAVGIFIYDRKRYLRDRTALTLLILSVLFTIATIRSRRYVEYLAPVLWLWTAYTILPFVVGPVWKKLVAETRTRLGRAAPWLIGYFIVTVPLGIGLSYARAFDRVRGGLPLTTLQTASQTLRERAPAGAVVFHSSWDEFPMLYFHNPNNVYIVGLDATFMYLHDRVAYERWNDISTGKAKQASVQQIKDYFHARYVAFNPAREHTQLLLAYLLRDSQARVLYRDDTNIVFELL